MKIQANNFIQLAEIAVHDAEQQAAVAKAVNTAFAGRQVAMAESGMAHGEAMRTQAAGAKRRALARLPELLEQAEARMQENGIEVLWAIDGDEACRHVLEIARQHGAKLITKSKSMMTEEIGLNEVLESAEIRVVETDLGEYILQLNHEAPSHIVAPVIHKSKASIRAIFEREIAMPATDDAETMAHYAREKLRADFLAADLGISGGNFIIAESGTLCLVTNEGNARMVTNLPPVHIAVVGIEKIVADLDDYATLTQVLPRSGTGQKMTVYTHMVNGPRRADEADGAQHVYVILVDNGRSKIYASEYADALACIRCGACLNACPVYQQTGGHAYGWVYPGPIGSIITPLLKGLEQASPLPFASSLCGACFDVCPVKIDMPRMLLDLRRDLVAMGATERSMGWGIKAWAQGMATEKRFVTGGKLARLATDKLPLEKLLPKTLKGWTAHRELPEFAPKSFHQLWEERVDNS
ncbi:MAG TPA: iron-sulfur cluster-binding protein [Anaerolineae bacterium]|nr:iron-sulfur cluster-binding protein [Anaerolineae bacterium]